MVEFLRERYDIGSDVGIKGIVKNIISNAISRSTLISYKLFDRNVVRNSSGSNIYMICQDSSKYIAPQNNLSSYGVYKRSYTTDTEFYLAIYCNLFAKFKYNLETYFLNVFEAALEMELENLDAIGD